MEENISHKELVVIAKEALEDLDPEFRYLTEQISEHLVLVYESVVQTVCELYKVEGEENEGLCNFVFTSNTFMNCVQRFKMLLKKRKTHLDQELDRFGGFIFIIHTAEEQIEVLKEEYKTMREKLEEKKKIVCVIVEKVKKSEEYSEQSKQFQAELDQNNRELQSLQEMLHDFQNQISHGTRLCYGLRGDRIRWNETLLEFRLKKNMIGDCLLVSSFVTYLGPFSKPHRQKLIQSWVEDLGKKVEIPFTRKSIDDPHFLMDILLGLSDKNTTSSTEKLIEWENNGLPKDLHSVENGVILFGILGKKQYPLFVDPQNRALRWIKYQEEMDGIRIISFDDEFEKDTLEECMRKGIPVLIEKIEKNFIALKSILEQVEHHPNFRLFLHTSQNLTASGLKNLKPHLQYLKIINFEIEKDACEEKLLDTILSFEKPELERRRIMFDSEHNKCKIKLLELEKDFLGKLETYSQGQDILKSRTIVEELEYMKATTIQIDKKVDEIRSIGIQINGEREKYRPVSHLGTEIYFEGEYETYDLFMEGFKDCLKKSMMKSFGIKNEEEIILNMISCVRSLNVK